MVFVTYQAHSLKLALTIEYNRVSVNAVELETQTMIHGVPQGSVLGP